MGNTTIYKKLLQLQQDYSAPKDAYNSFGGYSYRNFESMLDGLKPLLAQYGLVLTTTNSLRECAGHVYVQSTCILTDTETGESVSSDSFAREDDSRKGMSAAQLTGSCVSYSAKYALGLLMSVGTGQRDADSMDNRPQTQSRPQPPQTRPTPPPQQPMQAPQYQPPMQTAPAPQYTAPPMPSQQTAPPMQYQAPPMPPQYQAPMPPQQPMTAPPVQQTQPMAQQPPMQTPPQPPVQAQPQPPISADGVKHQADVSADAPTPPFTRKPRPARPADGSAPVAPHLTPSALPASWGINESTAITDENEPQMAENTGWMSVPDGIDEGELPFA